MADREIDEEPAASEAGLFYLHLRDVFTDAGARPRSRRQKVRRRSEDPANEPYGPGRDPKGLGDALESLSAQLGWRSNLAQSDLMLSWVAIAGEETAKHATPAGIDDGQLTVQCESTAWATQLRLMRVEIMTRIAQQFPDAGIRSIRFLGPDAPSWKKGPRSIPGRGPRDTYG